MTAFALVLALLLLPVFASSQESATFLKIGVGARALGMGGAYTAVADDVSAVAWNPAGLSAIASREFGFMHAETLGSTRYQFLGYAQPTRVGTLAAGLRRLGQGAIEGRDSMGRPNGSFVAHDTSIDLAYGLRLSERFRMGTGIRYVTSRIAEASANGYGIDLGGLYRAGRWGPGDVQLGIAVQNIGPGMKFLDQGFPMPLAWTTGLGYKVAGGLIFGLDYRYRPYAKASEINLGTEYALVGGFMFRAGYASAAALPGGTGIAGIQGLAAGFGLVGYGYSLDYSITPFGELGRVHRFSFAARF